LLFVKQVYKAHEEYFESHRHIESHSLCVCL